MENIKAFNRLPIYFMMSNKVITRYQLNLQQSNFLAAMYPEFGLSAPPPLLDIDFVNYDLAPDIFIGVKREFRRKKIMPCYSQWIADLDPSKRLRLCIDRKYSYSKSLRILAYELCHEIGHYLHSLSDRQGFRDYLHSSLEDPLEKDSNFFELVAELGALSYAFNYGGDKVAQYYKRYMKDRVFGAALNAFQRDVSIKELLSRKGDEKFIESFWPISQ